MNIATVTLKFTGNWIHLENLLKQRLENDFTFQTDREYYIQVHSGYLLLQESSQVPVRGKEGVLLKRNLQPAKYTKGEGDLYVQCTGNNTVTFNVYDNK